MDSPVLGLILDSSPLIAAERHKLTAVEAIKLIRSTVGDLPVALSVVTIIEIGHGIYRAKTSEVRNRRQAFVEELRAVLPIYPVNDASAEIVWRLGGEQAAKGINLPLADLMIGACALERGYAVVTHNERDFGRIPGLTVVMLEEDAKRFCGTAL